jgi:hypothetical protein
MYTESFDDQTLIVKINEYDDRSRLIYQGNFQYEGVSPDSLSSYSEYTRKFNNMDQVSMTTFYRCQDNGRCTLDIRTREYNDRQELIAWQSVETTYQDGEEVDENVYSFETAFRCDLSKNQEIRKTNGIVTQRTEYIYPIAPDCEGVSIEENTVVAPNPASDRVTVWTTFLNGLETEIRIMNMAGRILKEDRTKASYYASFNVGDIPPGLYIIHLSRETGSVTKQVMIVR